MTRPALLLFAVAAAAGLVLAAVVSWLESHGPEAGEFEPFNEEPSACPRP
jgi:hypothetical protein